MLRYRRYRVFVAFAVIAIFALYKFGTSGPAWGETKSPIADGRKDEALPPVSWVPRPHVAQETKKLEIDIPAAKTSRSLLTPPPIASVSKPRDKDAPAATPVKPAPGGLGSHENDNRLPGPAEVAQLNEQGEGRLEVPTPPSTISVIHWKKTSEHFPVPAGSTIQLPSGTAKPIPKIQHTFKEESPSAKADRETKLNTIKGVFMRSWSGYRKFAWKQDELKPVSGKYRNPFASWGATLVDSLDTLWIMGLKDEFEEAVDAVKELDFTTTTRPDIPLFETTIRYLGGLIAAYDVSEYKYKILIEKAVELAEVLISAFDSPNRMPQTYYYWRPSFSSQPHRASNRVVLAEIGSLSMEFTRLAQLTGEPKWYDAIARITNALEEFQNKTRLTGMWPTYLDASGCKKIDYSSIDTPLQQPLDSIHDAKGIPDEDVTPTKPKVAESEEKPKMVPLDLPSPITFVAGPGSGGKIKNWDDETIVGDLNKGPEKPKMTPLEKPDPITFVAGPGPAGKIKNWDDETTVGDLNKGPGKPSHAKRQLDADTVDKAATNATPTNRPECEERGFVSGSEYGSEEYTLGGMSDSTYEYLPKEWLLLGGLEDKYRSMYEMSMDVVKENLIFRPMLPNEDDILFSGKFYVSASSGSDGPSGRLEAENAHLTCFAGGMFAMGAKIFDRKDDLEIAKKLTEGCVWSYNSTSTGIMPEAFITIPCKSTKKCAWNETLYWEILDPSADSRQSSYENQMKDYEIKLAEASAVYQSALAELTAAPSTSDSAFSADATPAMKFDNSLRKRQLEGKPAAAKASEKPVPRFEEEEDPGPPSRVQPQPNAAPSKSLPAFPVVYSPKPPLNHEQYVKNRIQEERLPPGVVSIKANNYILRPEAIESVWYLYRITGDTHWRTVGWEMFNAINQHTATEYGNSAIDDVTKTSPNLNDEMESFWLAETLKYFYLLFADEELISLDDWVLNTEAHPFKRPKGRAL